MMSTTNKLPFIMSENEVAKRSALFNFVFDDKMLKGIQNGEDKQELMDAKLVEAFFSETLNQIFEENGGLDLRRMKRMLQTVHVRHSDNIAWLMYYDIRLVGMQFDGLLHELEYEEVVFYNRRDAQISGYKTCTACRESLASSATKAEKSLGTNNRRFKYIRPMTADEEALSYFSI